MYSINNKVPDWWKNMQLYLHIFSGGIVEVDVLEFNVSFHMIWFVTFF